MDKIDLDAIMDSKKRGIPVPIEVLAAARYLLRDCMREAIHQALVLASESAKTRTLNFADALAAGPGNDIVVDKQSILDVDKLIVG